MPFIKNGQIESKMTNLEDSRNIQYTSLSDLSAGFNFKVCQPRILRKREQILSSDFIGSYGNTIVMHNQKMGINHEQANLSNRGSTIFLNCTKPKANQEDIHACY